MTTAQQLSSATLWWLSFGIAALLGALPAAAYLRRLDREDRDAQSAQDEADRVFRGDPIDR